MFTRLRAHKSQMRRFTPWCCRLAFIPQSSHVSKNWHSKPGRLFKNTQLFRLNAFLHSFSKFSSVTKVDSSVQQFQCQKNSCDISQEKFDLCGWSIFRRWTSSQGYCCYHGGNWGPKFTRLEVNLGWTITCGLFSPFGKLLGVQASYNCPKLRKKDFNKFLPLIEFDSKCEFLHFLRYFEVKIRIICTEIQINNLASLLNR